MPEKHQPPDETSQTDGPAPRKLTPDETEELASEYLLVLVTDYRGPLTDAFLTTQLGLVDADGSQDPEAIRETIRAASHRIGGAHAEHVDDWLEDKEDDRGLRPLPIHSPEQAEELLFQYMTEVHADNGEGGHDG